MNIRTVANPITPIDSPPKVERSVSMNESHQDRDADGRQQQKEQDQSPLSEQEMKQAQNYLESLDGLKANGLKISIEETAAIRVFVITDGEGKIVRRIPEHEMRLLISPRQAGGSGRIFHKAG